MDSERRNSNNRPLERSASYSEAIKSSSDRFSIEIPSLVRSEVYTNEELKKQYRISQNYVEGREIQFPVSSNGETGVYRETSSDSSSDDDDNVFPNGLVMKIDVETCDSESLPKYSSPATTVQVSSASPRQTSPSEDLYDVIETEGSVFSAPETLSTPTGYSTPYSRRKRRIVKHRLRQGRPNRSRRVVFKSGEENVPVRSNIPAKSIKYMRDIVNTVINSKWRFILLMMVVAHFCFWLFFAGIWVWVSRAYQEDIGDGKDHCVTGTSTFAGMLMMAVETQMTIGYGTRFPNEECPEAIIVMVLEIVAGTALSGGLTSLLFTKLVRPNRHVSSVGFSKKATVCLRDGELCLQFRVWDLLNVHVINTTITAYILKPIRTLEGEIVQNYIQNLKLVQANSFLLWPITVAHIIDQNSPLYDLSAEDMMDFRFEIVVCLTGSSHNLGTMTQSRTSYLSKEIIWGYRFKSVLNYSKKDEAYTIDTDSLNSVEQVETPLCSASKLKEFEDASRKNYDDYDGSTIYQGSSPSTLRTGNSSAAQTDIWSRNGATAALARNLAARIQPDVWQANPKQAPKDWQNSPKDWQKSQKGWQKSPEGWHKNPEGWLNTPSSSASPREESVQSTPNFSRHGTQKSIGWSFRRFTRENIVEDRFKGLNS